MSTGTADPGSSSSLPPHVIETLASAEHYRNAIDAAPIGIICVSGASGKYVFVNEAFARMIGRTREEVLQTDPYEIAVKATHPDDVVVSREAIQLLARGTADRHRYEKRLISKAGQELWVTVDMLATRDAEGRLAFLTQQFTDIHERRQLQATCDQLQQQLHQMQKLEALGRLAGGVAHDFNNRLVVIMGYAQLLRERLPASSPLIAHTDRVLESALRAAELTHQLLAYGRRQVLKPRVFALNACLDTMRRLLERLVGDDIALTMELNAAHPIVADPGQIEQVIINLAMNARDAMPRGGRLLLETADSSLASEHAPLAAGDYVTLRVTDTGTGIAAEVLPRIFEPFFTTKEVGRGTGLGLSTVEGIIHQSGGAVRVRSQPDSGTTFEIYLPRATELPAQPVRSGPQLPITNAGQFETVLVCDDDDEVRQLIANVLSLRGYTVLQAHGAKQALAIATAYERPIQLLVTDLVMPELDGIELAEQLRRHQRRMSVLYISGYTERVSLLADQLDLDTQFLQKPFLPSDLTHRVCAMLERYSAS